MIRFMAAVGACAALAGCDRAPATPSPPSTPGVEQLIGGERLGWDQEAPGSAELSVYTYLLYVDGSASDLQDVSCSSSRGASGFACNARLPSMSPGRHTLELSAVATDGGRAESERSAPLQVHVIASAASLASAVAVERLTTSDGLRLVAAVVADGLSAPADLGFAPDGRLYVAERTGQIRIVRNGQLLAAPAVTLPDVVVSERGGLLALAVDPQFARTGFVFAIYTSDRGMRLARFRAVGDTLGDRAILLDGLVGFDAVPAALRFGPDGKLYAALGDGGRAGLAGDLGAYHGKVLRVEPDGGIPADQPLGTPVFASGINAPRGLAWAPDGEWLWVAETDEDGVERLQAVSAGGARIGGGVAARYTLPAGTSATGVVISQSDRMAPFRGDLFVADDGTRSVLRFRFALDDPLRIVATERLLAGALDGARAIAVGPDGAVYLCTANAIVRLEAR
jgi:glucose/arabinose dehydrogenase